jgi:hypothetical protein
VISRPKGRASATRTSASASLAGGGAIITLAGSAARAGFLMTGDLLTAEEAHRRLVNHVVPADQLLARRGSPIASPTDPPGDRGTKVSGQILRNQPGARHLLALELCFTTTDREAIDAFSKRGRNSPGAGIRGQGCRSRRRLKARFVKRRTLARELAFAVPPPSRLGSAPRIQSTRIHLGYAESRSGP